MQEDRGALDLVPLYMLHSVLLLQTHTFILGQCEVNRDIITFDTPPTTGRIMQGEIISFIIQQKYCNIGAIMG